MEEMKLSRTLTTSDSFCCSLPLALQVLVPSSLLLARELPSSESLGLTTSILVSVSCLETVCWLGPIEDCCCGTAIHKIKNRTPIDTAKHVMLSPKNVQ